MDLLEPCRRAAEPVDRILRGARAGDLPVEEAVKFDVVINVATANSLESKIPSSLRKRDTAS
jgi:putative ABC transport system substrate-binding protein